MPIYDKPDPTKLHQHAKKTRILAGLAAIALGCAVYALSPVADAAGQDCGEDSRLGTRLYGAIDQLLDWSPDALQCESMGRPHGKGIRLRFTGPAADAEASLTVIIALPNLKAGESRKELAANLTVIEDSTGRFYGSKSTNSCWADIEQESLSLDSTMYRVSGTVYCINPLAQVNGQGSVRFEEIEFRAAADWSPDT
jgi:hypothetical protein